MHPSIWCCLFRKLDNFQTFRRLALVCKDSATAARVMKNEFASKFVVFERTANNGWQEFITISSTKQLLHGSFGTRCNQSGPFNVSYYRFGKRVTEPVQIEFLN